MMISLAISVSGVLGATFTLQNNTLKLNGWSLAIPFTFTPSVKGTGAVATLQMPQVRFPPLLHD